MKKMTAAEREAFYNSFEPARIKVPRAAGPAFQLTFEEANALVASYMRESSVDRHAAGAAIAKVMQERMRRAALPRTTSGKSR